MDKDEEGIVLVPVDGAWWVAAVVGFRSECGGSRRMTTTMPIAVHTSEDGSKLSILGRLNNNVSGGIIPCHIMVSCTKNSTRVSPRA